MSSQHDLRRSTPWSATLALAAVLAASPLTTGTSHAQSIQEADVPLDVGVVAVAANSAPFRRTIDYASFPTPDLLGTRPGVVANSTTIVVYVDPGVPVGGWNYLTNVYWQTAIPTNEDPVEVGDMDGDGVRDDILVAAGREVASLRGDPLSAPRIAHQVALPFEIDALAIADVDGDGIEDALILGQNDLIVSLDPMGPSPTSYHLGGLALAAKANVVVVPHANGDRTVLAGDQRFTFRSGQAPLWQGAVPGLTVHGTWCAGDIDGDGDVDAVLFGATREYQVLRQDAAGILNLEPVRAGGAATDLIDVDDDGDLDGACCGGSLPPPPLSPHNSYQVSHFEFSENDGQGNFAPSRRFRGYGANRLAGVLDIDGDGDLDWVAGRTIWFARDNDVFDRPYTPVFPQRGTAPFRAPVDLDQDGDLDLDWGQREFATGDSSGAAKLDTALVGGYPPANNVRSRVRADWNGDGLIDAIAPVLGGGNFGRGESGGQITWLAGTRYLGGRDEVFQGEGLNVDIDGDGWLDRVKYDEPSGSTLVALGNGDGSFLPVATRTNLRVFEFADFDGNGLLDALGLRTLGPTSELVIHYQSAPRVFGAGVRLVSGPLNEGQPLVTDLDDDGRLDIVYSPAGTTRHNALWNRPGAFGFQREILHAGSIAQGGPMSYARLDLDQDGVPEILASPAPGAPGACVVLIRGAPFVYSAGLTLAIQPWALGDCDGDGDLDVYDRAEGSIARGLAHHGAAGGQIRQYGEGSPGRPMTGFFRASAPLLGATGPFRPGGATTIRIRRGGSGEFAVLGFSLRPLEQVDYPFAGITTYLDPFAADSILLDPIQLPSSTTSTTVAGSADIVIPLPVQVAGLEVHHQVFTTSSRSTSGWSASNGLVIRYGQ